MMHGDSEIVRWFEAVGVDDRPSVGGKGASLGELVRAGIQVPPGFVVTTGAFKEFVDKLDKEMCIRERIAALDPDDVAAIGTVTEAVRGDVMSADLPTDVYDAIEAAYVSLCGEDGDTPVAVRSSATSEDSAEASFAGLQDTYLWVIGAEQVAEYVKQCWASLYSTESVSYRLRRVLSEIDLAMGVVVQRMVNSYASGVMFTRSPTTGDPSVIAIEGSWGLGSSIVSGEVTPDTLLVNKVTGEILKREISRKTVQHVPDLTAGGVREEPVPEARQTVNVLSDADIAELVETAKRIERHYGCPQDIEWAMERDSADAPARVYMLQSRPETVWSGKSAEPAAKPKASAMDHVFSVLSGGKT